MTCKERVVEYLIQSYEKKNKNHSDIYMISNTQTELADRIGFNLRSVQRCVAGLVKENLISIKGGKIFISHEQFMRLKQYVDDK